MKKNLMVLSMLVFFATGMIAQAPATTKKECPKTETACSKAEAKKDCDKSKKENCDKAKACTGTTTAAVKKSK